jgi:cytochrome c-type biogenesis protein CcmH/NrfF
MFLMMLALAAPAAAEPRASLPDIEDEVMCPICGTLLQLSDSPQAERERDFIRARIDQGQSKEQIKDALVAEYGEEVLATPEGAGFDLAAWLLPLLAFLGAVLALIGWLRRRGRVSRTEPQPLNRAEAERLEADLARDDPS